jgi:hypothetical protein
VAKCVLASARPEIKVGSTMQTQPLTRNAVLSKILAIQLRSRALVCTPLLALLCVAVAHAAAGQSCTDVAITNLVSWWQGEGDAKDLMGSNRGRLQNGVTFAAGKVGLAFQFDGVDDFVQLPDNFFPYPSNGDGNIPFTFELWFSTTNGGVILGQHASSGYVGYVPGIWVGIDGLLYVEMFWKGFIDPIVSAVTVNDGVFHHATAVCDGTNETVYLDGVLVDSKAHTQVIYAPVFQYTLGTGESGGWPAGNGGWFPFQGLLDEVTLYNRVLDAAEVEAIVNAGNFGKCVPAKVCSISYTTDADFDQGTLHNLNHSPNHDQLQLNGTSLLRPYVNIACSARGTIVRINVNTGEILGEYLTAPDGMGRNPSRTTVDKFGNAWVANRNEGGFSGGQNKGSVARIALVVGGTRGDRDEYGVFTPNPAGQYLQPPFTYTSMAVTNLDRDGDGLIKTSLGSGNILLWTNTAGADTDGGVSTSEDELIVTYTRVTGTGTRTIAVDANNDVWVGGTGDLDHEKLDGVTGLPVPGTQFNLGCGGYGGLVDGNGVLWSAQTGAGLLRYNTITMTGQCLGNVRGDYGLGVDPLTGHIWHTFLYASGVAELDEAGNLLHVYPHGEANAQGVAVDDRGNVWVAHSLFGSTTVGHLRTDGTFVGNVTLPGGNGPTGVAVDINGKVWVANINTDNAMRIDPDAGPIGGGGHRVGAVDMVVDLGAGAGPYNYSDMTGFVALGSTAARGNWTVTHDSRRAGTQWDRISWASIEPAGTRLVIEARAADSLAGLPSQTYQTFPNGASACGLAVNGRFIEVRANFSRDIGITNSPVLSNLTVECFSGIAPGNLRFSATNYNISEAGASVTVTVARSCGSAGQVAVDYSVTNGTAMTPEDYGTNAGTLVFEDGELARTFTIPIFEDGLYEYDETIRMTLSNPTGGATLGTVSTATVTILDNEGPPALYVGSVIVGEGKSGSTVALFDVALSAASGRTTTVAYATIDSSAIAGEDYVATNGSLVFLPGETLKTVSVPIIGDTLIEPDETFQMILSNAVNATIGSGVGTGTIIGDDNPDQAPRLALQGIAFNDSSGNANGVAEPGETISLSIVLANAGPVAASAVGARLTTAIAGVSVAQSNSVYGSIAILGSRTNTSPFQFSIDGSVPCGTPIDFALVVTNNAGSTNFTFQIVLGTAQPFFDNMESGPANWTHSAASGSDTWAILADANAVTPFRAWHMEDIDGISDQRLVLNPITVPAANNPRLRFWHTFAFERGFDGGVIEISIDGGATYADAGPLILSGNYNGSVSTLYGNPLGGRNAWTGADIGAMTEVIVDLTAYAGQQVRFRWRVGTDSSVARPGWSIDDVRITADAGCTTDLDSVGDGITDAWRARYFGGSGTTTNAESCAACDADADGMANWQEFMAGTSPISSGSALRIISVDPTGDDVRVTWTTVAGKSYLLQRSDALENSFFDLPMTPISAPGVGESTTNYVDVGASLGPAQYYRVRLGP